MSDQSENLLHDLIMFEAELLRAPDRVALKHIAVNSVRNILPIGQAFLTIYKGKSLHICAVSHQDHINTHAPFMQWLKRQFKTARKSGVNFITPATFTLGETDPFDTPFTYAFWAPFSPNAHAGGMLFTRASRWTEEEQHLLERVGENVGVNWIARDRKKYRTPKPFRKLTVIALAASALFALSIPVPTTTLAQAEIIAKNPFLITAPLDGVIANIHVEPGMLVKKGTLLVSFDNTHQRNEVAVSVQEKHVASARKQQATLSAFSAQATQTDLAIIRAEQDLAAARHTYAVDRLANTKLHAPRSGIVIYSDKKDWIGRPVATGEKLMQITNATQVHIRLETPISDTDILQRHAKVRMFLDANPLQPLNARLTRANFTATPQANGRIAYLAYAEFENLTTLPRIGGRGVAKIYGDKAPLGLWLFRRPLAHLRQRIGF